jgi:D-amino-acid dehydrogenase
MRELTELALAASVTIRWWTQIEGWRTSGVRIAAAATTQGEIEADEFVLAAGSWSAEVARTLQCKLPLQAGKDFPALRAQDTAQVPAVGGVASVLA